MVQFAGVPLLDDGKRFVILFDISKLVADPNSTIDPELAKAQLSGRFARWDVPNFEGRMRQAYINQTQ